MYTVYKRWWWISRSSLFKLISNQRNEIKCRHRWEDMYGLAPLYSVLFHFFIIVAATQKFLSWTLRTHSSLRANLAGRMLYVSTRWWERTTRFARILSHLNGEQIPWRWNASWNLARSWTSREFHRWELSASGTVWATTKSHSLLTWGCGWSKKAQDTTTTLRSNCVATGGDARKIAWKRV